MTITELYINNRLCDIDRDFDIRLNRRLLKPGELNAKDAQYSYSITLPTTDNNRAIFSYADIEETRGKFNREYRAELIINGLRVFSGLLRLSEISRDAYKGNLYVPAVKSIRDIFGDRKLNENEPYPLEFKDFVEYVSYYNILSTTGPQMAIFPYTLYGVLPKVPLPGTGNNYTPRDLWDESVHIGMRNFPPSINPMLMLRHIFESRGYELGGTAFNDERLTHLYMSYKNDPDYKQPWNYGYHGRIRIRGEWSNLASGNRTERGVYETSQDDGAKLYACDLFDCNNVIITETDDPGGNVLSSDRTDDNNRRWRHVQVSIPAAGYYKIRLRVSTKLRDRAYPILDRVTGILFVGATGPESGYGFMRSALKLLRDRGKGDFGIPSSRMDGALYKDNLPQNSRFDAENTPKYLPKYNGADIGSVVFVDLAQNENHVAGFQVGKLNDEDVIRNDDTTPTDNLAKITAAKPAVSWDNNRTRDVRNRLVIANSGYVKYGLPESGGGDTPVWTDGDDNRYAYKVLGAPRSFVRRGQYNGTAGDYRYNSEGELNCVIWLEEGELLTLADVSDRGVMVIDPPGYGQFGWVAKTVTFDLSVEPFQTNIEWLKIDEAGVQIPGATMNWNDATDLDTDSIDLVRFLPADMKTDDFIDNFCKAFNLQLTQTGTTTFELNVKQSKTAVSSRFINLDNLASVRDRTNTPLGLPSVYGLGFTVDTEEEGYVMTHDDGGGRFETGAAEENIVEQKSTFSYNWFKDITKRQGGHDIIMPLSVITKHEVWTSDISDADAQRKSYTNQAIRFWYTNGSLNDLGADFEINGKPLYIAAVSGEMPARNILSYKNQEFTILTNYFTLLMNGSSHYTEIEGYLTPDQYENLNGSIMAMFNGDLYYVAEITGYDPTGHNKAKIKLIRKI